MTDEAFDDMLADLALIRQARENAEELRDQLAAEYARLLQDQKTLPPDSQASPRRRAGLDAMRRAIAAADRALDSIGQALREIAQSQDQDPSQPQ